MQDIDPYASRGSWASNRNVPFTTDNKHRAINHGVFAVRSVAAVSS
nr:hypothetical protein [uncultured Campylobacter sp.]